MNERSQLNSQFEAVVMERHFARTLSGKISPVTTHAAVEKKERSDQINPLASLEDRSLRCKVSS